MKTHALPDSGLPFYSRAFSFRQQVLPVLERVLQSQYFQFASERPTKVYEQKPEKEEAPKRRGPFPHEFPTVVPDEKSKKVDSSFLGDWKSYGQSWSWLRFSSRQRGKETEARSSDGNGRKKRCDSRLENKKFYVPRNSSTMSESSEDDNSDSFAGTEAFTRSLQ